MVSKKPGWQMGKLIQDIFLQDREPPSRKKGKLNVLVRLHKTTCLAMFLGGLQVVAPRRRLAGGSSSACMAYQDMSKVTWTPGCSHCPTDTRA